MSKKDYIAIAEIFRKYKGSNLDAQTMRTRIAADIAEVLKQDNPKFSYLHYWGYIDEIV